MPASPGELAQLKQFAAAMTALIQAIEARDKAQPEAALDTGAPPARLSRLA